MHVYTYENTGARPVKTNSETFKGYPGKVSLFWNETVPRISIKIIRTRTSHVVNVRRETARGAIRGKIKRFREDASPVENFVCATIFFFFFSPPKKLSNEELHPH